MFSPEEKMFLDHLGQGLNAMPPEMIRGVLIQTLQQIFVRCPDDETWQAALDNLNDEIRKVTDPTRTTQPEELQVLLDERQARNDERRRLLDFDGFVGGAQAELKSILDQHGVLDEEDEGHAGGNYL